MHSLPFPFSSTLTSAISAGFPLAASGSDHSDPMRCDPCALMSLFTNFPLIIWMFRKLKHFTNCLKICCFFSFSVFSYPQQQLRAPCAALECTLTPPWGLESRLPLAVRTIRRRSGGNRQHPAGGRNSKLKIMWATFFQEKTRTKLQLQLADTPLTTLSFPSPRPDISGS